MIRTVFSCNKTCSCFNCVLVPVCQNKCDDYLLRDCIIIRDYITSLCKDVIPDKTITHVTIHLIPLKRELSLSTASLLYWSLFSYHEYGVKS